MADPEPVRRDRRRNFRPALAYRLRQLGVPVTLLEAPDRVGGLIDTVERDGFLFESGPQSFQGTDTLLDLVRELGIENELCKADPRAPRYVLRHGKTAEDPDVAAGDARQFPAGRGRRAGNRFRGFAPDETSQRGGIRRGFRAAQIRTRNSRVSCRPLCFRSLRGRSRKAEPARGISDARRVGARIRQRSARRDEITPAERRAQGPAVLCARFSAEWVR